MSGYGITFMDSDKRRLNATTSSGAKSVIFQLPTTIPERFQGRPSRVHAASLPHPFPVPAHCPRSLPSNCLRQGDILDIKDSIQKLEIRKRAEQELQHPNYRRKPWKSWKSIKRSGLWPNCRLSDSMTGTCFEKLLEVEISMAENTPRKLRYMALSRPNERTKQKESRSTSL